MSGTTDIIFGGAAILGVYLLATHWQEVQAALQGPFQGAQVGPDTSTYSSGGGGSASSPPSVTAGAVAAGSAGVTLTGKPSSSSCSNLPRPISDADARRCKLGPYAPTTTLNNVTSAVGYYRNYSVPVMGPQWRDTIPAHSGPTELSDPYLSYHSEVFGKKKESYHTTINPKTGAKIVTIDPFFPAGFYNSQANYTSSLNDPAVRGGS